MTATKPGIIYLQKDKFQIFSPFIGSILEFRFTPDVIRDLDVVNLDTLGAQIKQFVINGKIPPGNMSIVLCDNAYFVKDFLYPAPPAPPKPGQPPVAVPKLSLEDLKKQADLFVEHVPYDNVVSKNIPLKNGIRVCAVNQDLYGSLKIAFEALGFKIDAVLPGLVVGNGLSAKPVLDGAMANFILQRTNALKQYDLVTQSAFEPEVKSNMPGENIEEVEIEEPQDAKKVNKKRLIALTGVFASLIVVLVIVYVQSQTPPTPPQQPAQASSPPAAAAPPAAVNNPQPTQQEAASDASQMQNLSIQIVNASDSASVAQSLKTQLGKYTFKSITLLTQSGVGTASTVVSFSGTTSQSVRNTILDEVRKIKPDITVQEKQDGSSDISIIIGK
jgi:hypothetical protein